MKSYRTKYALSGSTNITLSLQEILDVLRRGPFNCIIAEFVVLICIWFNYPSLSETTTTRCYILQVFSRLSVTTDQFRRWSYSLSLSPSSGRNETELRCTYAYPNEKFINQRF
ncbi:hypothetical protein Y032_0147g2587 [Ancylostoma ceylanicum]|nr:hypothetical protein Y032_0147g2587 [Ancylostoma ceylanicum]